VAYADPQTTHNPTTGAVIPASWGDIVRDDLEYLARNKPHCRVYNSANVSIPNLTRTAVTFNSERYDVGGCHSTAVNTSRLTVPAGEGGKYVIGGCVEFAGNATGTRQVEVYVNGTTLIAIQKDGAPDANPFELTINTEYALSAGDYVELTVYQTSGGALNVLTASAYSPEFWMRWVAV
jgi:hypothetical protein